MWALPVVQRNVTERNDYHCAIRLKISRITINSYSVKVPYKWKYWRALNLAPNRAFINIGGFQVGDGPNLASKNCQVLNLAELNLAVQAPNLIHRQYFHLYCIYYIKS